MRALGSTQLAILFGLAITSSAQAASVSLSTPQPRPGASLIVTGAGFGAGEAVDVYIDTLDTLLIVSNASGGFSATLKIPASESSGPHFVTAIGRHSGAAAQASLRVSTPWAQYGFGASDFGWNTTETDLTPGNAGSLGALWSKPLPNGSGGGTPAILYPRLVVAGQNNVAVALNLVNGAPLWTGPSGQSFASPAIGWGAAFVAGSDGTLYALNLTTGAVKWSVSLGGRTFASATLVSNAGVNTVYIGSSSFTGGVFYALNANTGATIWSFSTTGEIDGSAAYYNGAVFFGARDNKFYALDATTGAALWTDTFSGQVESSPAVGNGVVYVGSDDHNVYALNWKTGATLWSFATGGSVYASPALSNGVVYIGSADNFLYALNATTGAALWAYAVSSTVRSATVAGGVIYVSGDSGRWYALDANGALLTSGVGSTYFGRPAVADGVLYISDTRGPVTAYAPGAGAAGSPSKSPAAAPDPKTLTPDYSLTPTN